MTPKTRGPEAAHHQAQRLHVAITGAVQGVGFRPFVYRLATELALPGWVLNSLQGVTIEVEGDPATLQRFVHGLENDKPALSTISSLQTTYLDPVGFTEFEIRHSDDRSGSAGALILPDLATCPDCLREVLDPADRRFRYPFTNCTNCGPRFSIIQGLPYDRPLTTMRGFEMCPECRHEYENPLDRRFHAQPNACPVCGPHLELWDAGGEVLAEGDEALRQAAQALRDGRIVAMKGLGGFHLLVDARSEEAVVRLRERKRREEKPLALMYPNMEQVREACEVEPTAERLLLSPQTPIVLLKRRTAAGPPSGLRPDTPQLAQKVSPSVAPGNPFLGVMLPYTPLHHLLLDDLQFPGVATSGNISDEPICTDEREALRRLEGIADLFLVHNRPIARHVDDSVVRVIEGRPLMLRRARGYAPLPVPLPHEAPPMLAVGAHQKNNTAVSIGKSAFISQHIGDLETAPALEAFVRVSRELPELYAMQPELIVSDLHPDYLSTQYARQTGLPLVQVQHHVAHVLSCMAENELAGPVLGFAWDGSGYGGDGTIWGGETLLVDGGVERVAHLRLFPLPGGEKAVKQPRRVALGILYELYGDEAFEMDWLTPVQSFSRAEAEVLRQMLRRGLNAPRTSSMGRLFDAVAALAGLRQQVNFEGQAAMELEFLLDGVETDEAYPLAICEGRPLVMDWQPLIEAVLADVRGKTPAGMISVRFHNALAGMIVELTQRLGQERIVLTGGCFQNRYLTERTVELARAAGLKPYWHQNVPPNDGGISLGQIIYATQYHEGGGRR